MGNIKNSISMNHISGKAQTQITLNDDFNVAEDKPDIYKKITETGEVVIEGAKAQDNKASVNGCLKFSVLYQADYGSQRMKKGSKSLFSVIEGKIEFTENINVAGVLATDNVKAFAKLEDLQVTVINSRKISVLAVVSVSVYGESISVTMAVTDIEDETACILKKDITQLALFENKKDILRIREQYELPSGKPNMGNIIWCARKLRNMEIKAAAGELIIKGIIYIFMMYEAEDSAENIQSLEAELPFAGKLSIPACTDNMIADVRWEVSQGNMQIKPDYDGEPRIAECEMVLDMDIKIYEEQKLSLVTDAYSTVKELKPVYSKAGYDRLMMHNHTRCRNGGKFKVDDRKEKILQLINSDASVNMDEITVDANGIMVEGAICAKVLYVSSNDDERIGCIEKEIPFSQHIDIADMNKECFYNVYPELEQLSVMMLGSDEIEIKSVIGLDALVLESMEAAVITEIEEAPADMDRIRKLPGIYGHIVKEGETLWSVAKEHNTTMEKIMENNRLASESIKAGMKLIVVKDTVHI